MVRHRRRAPFFELLALLDHCEEVFKFEGDILTRSKDDLCPELMIRVVVVVPRDSAGAGRGSLGVAGRKELWNLQEHVQDCALSCTSPASNANQDLECLALLVKLV
jgi:hypothetical protein